MIRYFITLKRKYSLLFAQLSKNLFCVYRDRATYLYSWNLLHYYQFDGRCYLFKFELRYTYLPTCIDVKRNHCTLTTTNFHTHINILTYCLPTNNISVCENLATFKIFQPVHTRAFFFIQMCCVLFIRSREHVPPCRPCFCIGSL